MVSIHAAPILASQFFQGLFCRTGASSLEWQTPQPLSATVHRAAETLLDLVHTLCAPQSGWPTDTPLTPANLLPYVADEAEELLEALQQWLTDQATESPKQVASQAADEIQRAPELFADLSAFLLWAIAASTPAAMNLLEGVSAQLPQRPEAYGVRLVPVLEVQLNQENYVLDLATQTHFEPELTLADHTILPLSDPMTVAMSLAQWRTYIWEKVLAIAPHLQEWQRGIALQVLLPGREWLPTKAILGFKFVPMTWAVATARRLDDDDWVIQSDASLMNRGIPSARVWRAETPPVAVSETDVEAQGIPNTFQQFSLESEVIFETADALRRALIPIEIEQISHLWRTTHLTSEQFSSLDLLTGMFQALHLESSLLSPLLLSPLSLAELCHQVKWLWIRANQTLMPLMSGVSARRLPLGQSWETGTLVTLGHIIIQAGAVGQAIIDVSTGEWTVEPSTLKESDIVHLKTHVGLPQDLWNVGHLTDHLNALIQQRSPILAYLMEDVPMRLTSPYDALFPEPEALKGNLSLRFHLWVDFL